MRVVIISIIICAGLFAQPCAAFRVLFIGNSLTLESQDALKRFRNDSPLGQDVLSFACVGGLTLAEHATRPATLQQIRDGRFDYVVLQDHSLQPIRHPEKFYAGVNQLTQTIRAAGAEAVLFMTFARTVTGNYSNDQATVHNAYEHAAAQQRISVIRIGDVFNEIYRRDRSLFARLYQDDGIHPSELGAFTVASSVYKALYDSDQSWLAASLFGRYAKKVRPFVLTGIQTLDHGKLTALDALLRKRKVAAVLTTITILLSD